MSTKSYYTYSEEETEKLALRLSKYIPFGSTVALKGNLGAGKTVFARGFIRGLKIKDVVSSPTFTLIKEYLAPGEKWVYHLDLYRIADSEAALIFGIDEYLNDENAIALIEWSERIEDILPQDTIYINIDSVTQDSREIKVVAGFAENLPDID